MTEANGGMMAPLQIRQDAGDSTEASDEGTLPTASTHSSSKLSSASDADRRASSTKGTHTTRTNSETTHPAEDNSTYYKIKDHVTFAWNYTSLSATPIAIDILASCSANNRLYTISTTVSVSGAVQTVVWNTGAYQASATDLLLTEKYTLIVHDSDKDFAALASQTPRAEYLGVVDQFTFGMYLPKEHTEYTEFKAWKCVACSGAGALDQKTTDAVVGMACLTVLSFSWFSNVAGAW